MHTSPYGEDGRAPLTNQHIQADLKKTGTRFLLNGIWMTFWLGLLTFAFYMVAKIVQDKSTVFFWLAVIDIVYFGMCTIGNLVTFLWKAVEYWRAAGNRFFVTTDMLQSKQEGYTPAPALVVLASLFSFLRLFLVFNRLDRYRFSAHTYKVPVNSYHFAFDRDLDMNEHTLFQHSSGGDKFWLVSLKPGKPVKIYPEKRFRYTDSSPL